MTALRLIKLNIIGSVLVMGLACSDIKEQRVTLRSIDISGGQSTSEGVFVKPKTEEELRDAYYEYIKTATKSDNARLQALSRLAELELEIGEKKRREQATPHDNMDDEQYVATVNKTIALLNTSLKDYPKAPGNDKILHQLAEAYEQLGQRNNSVQALQRLIRKYPKSPYYIEAQFRLGEHYFIVGDYISAEDAYTEVIVTPENGIFYEKSLFKRGWSRYKQQLYLEAVDDYIDAVMEHNFADIEQLSKSEKEQFDEYFRAIGLAFAYLGGAAPLSDYFSDFNDFKYLYHTYTVVSDIYLSQERYSDAAATLMQYNLSFSDSKHVPTSRLKIIEIWQASRFTQQLYSALESFYLDYNPASPYWQQPQTDNETAKIISSALRQYTVLTAEYFHDRYQKDNKQADFDSARRWYERYLKHYKSYARQDNIFNLYAELLFEGKQYNEAMPYFELAAYDGDIILDKKAAYATITLSERLFFNSEGAEKETWLNKHLRYASTFVELYPQDENTNRILTYAAEFAFNYQRYDQAIRIAESLSNQADTETVIKINEIRAQAYFETKQYSSAEQVYRDLVDSKGSNKKQQDANRERLALSIYRQAEQAKDSGNMPLAAQQYIRAAQAAPQSEVTATAIYDAVAIAMSASAWKDAIDYIDLFKQRYPKHRFNTELSKKLSVAYLRSDQGLKAAREFERISSLDDDREVRKAALLQAAELYENKEDWQAAIRSYRDYANSFEEPFAQHMEVMFKLVNLYQKTKEPQKEYFWQNKIRKVDKRIARSQKTERTNYIASIAILGLAQEKHSVFNKQRLIEPLQQNLRKKKNSMQEAVKLYGQASIYGITEVTTEATHNIGEIYREFSRALLDSQRPASLSEEELEQYEILLEDQAFPFEEKAIEFYETNVRRTQNNVWNNWVAQSFKQLETLFPVRYQRTGKLEDFIDDLP